MRQFVVNRSLIAAAVIILFASSASTASAQAVADMPFFPGAEGFGGNWSTSGTVTMPTAGWLSNATVYRVTTTVDDPGPDGKGAPGTFRGAFRENTTNKIIVFDVAGTFQLTEGNIDIKNLSNYYIAGQTAPGPVTLYGDMVQLTHSGGKENRNVVLRYMSFRKGTADNSDSITFAGSGLGTNMILDHVSGSWSEDEVLSVANNNTNVTVQYSMIHDALVSGHAYGSLIRPRINSQVSFHHNLYANNASRQARFGTYEASTLTADFRNNVIYNFRDRASYTGGSSESEQEFTNVNYVGNYIVAGPGTLGNPNIAYSVDKNVTAQVYQSGNYVDPDKKPGDAIPDDNVLDGSDTGSAMFLVSPPVTDQTLAFVGAPFAVPPVTTQTAPDAYQQVVDHVGPWWWDRAADPINNRVINNVKDFTGVPIGAAAPIASELNALLAAPTVAHPVGYDADNDGMKDEWETAHGGNLTWNADFDNDGYINLIEFVNELGEFPAPAPIVFNGGLNSRYAHVMNWKTNDGGVTAGSNWQPSKYDEAQINSGTVVVDAVGQHAGVLRIGATAGSNGHLQVNSGWLEVADTVVVGAHETGQGILTMGGGQLIAEQVEVGFLGQLRGTGTLEANVTNSGAVLPGTSPGTLTIAGNYTQNMDGVLSLELASDASFDMLVVNGDIAYGGALEVLSPDYSPVLNDSFNLIDWTGTKSGFFEMLSLPGLDEGLEWDLSQLDTAGVLSVIAAAPVGLAGDYNDDGIVDAVDYTVWRNNLGDETEANINNNGDGMNGVDLADFDWWKQHYGDMAELGAGGLTSSVVPEPASFVLWFGAMLFALGTPGGRWRFGVVLR
jgi:hypothetical protein